MADQISYLIIGNGIAGVTAAEILRDEDSAASVAVIADDPFPVYYRPALKDYLGGRVSEDRLLARSSSFYQDRNIYFLPDRVIGIEVGAHAVRLRSGREVGYKHLLLAHGARASKLRCPGADLEGVTTLRSVTDYQRVLLSLNSVQRVVVVGSGTLALETTETLRYRGYEVTHLIRRRTLWSDVLDPTASDLILQQERRDGVDVRLEEEVAEIIGSRGRVCGVVTNQGSKINCEMVLIAIGIEPIVDFVKASGINTWRGIRVDNRMRTNARDIYAAGDVLETNDALTGRTRVVGQWYPAIQEARAAAYSMLDLLDTERPFRADTFYNATNLYGLNFASVGSTNIRGLQEIVAPPQPRTYRKVVLKEGVPIGMLALGERSQALAFKRAIDYGVSLSSVVSRLFDEDFKLSDWLDRQGVPPPLLTASRAGASAIKRAAYAEVDVISRKTVPMKDKETKAQQRISGTINEAVFVHVPDRVSGLLLPDTALSQTRVIVVGRQPGVSLLIDQGSVSRRHAEISYANGQYILQDLGSTNGTFVNEVRLQPKYPRILKPDDVVQFGNLVKFKLLMRTIDVQASGSGLSMAGIAPAQDIAPNRTTFGQPVIRPDGSLLLPGTESPISADVVATFRERPALILLEGVLGRNKIDAPQVVTLKKGKSVTLGRDKDNIVELADMAVSRHHAEVFFSQVGVYIRDLGSSNGVTINQTKIDNPYRLSHGDRIIMGGSVIHFIDLRSGRKQEKAAQVRSQVGRAESAHEPASPTTKLTLTTAVPRITMCAQCGAPNTSVARFCARCSASLGSGIR